MCQIRGVIRQARKLLHRVRQPTLPGQTAVRLLIQTRRKALPHLPTIHPVHKVPAVALKHPKAERVIRAVQTRRKAEREPTREAQIHRKTERETTRAANSKVVILNRVEATITPHRNRKRKK